MKLVIVESPTKAKTITKFLGKDYQIESSFGHVRDLPKSKIGIDIENHFEPHYIVPVKSKKTVTALKKLSAKSDGVILATDEDREGEAIAWHLSQVLGLDEKAERIVFHEITEEALHEALKKPRTIDMNLVDAQQARRILDRLVGYELSPFLWKKIFRGLSAGRVQSVALRLIVEREEEIRKFKPEAYWTLDAILRDGKSNGEFKAFLYKVNGKAIEKPGIKGKEEVDKIIADLKNAEFKVASVQNKEYRRNPLPPFTTSTMQQEANRRLRFSARQTMMFAQRLYENGLITYMRTDSVNLSSESLVLGRKFIKEEFGEKYLIESPRKFQNKSKLAQEAHEAIRPTNPLVQSPSITVEDEKERKLYDLIWRRFMASQMPQAVFDTVSVEISAGTYLFKSNGISLKFDGFLKVWPQEFEEKSLPDLSEGAALDLVKLEPLEHFTEPPARYNEASLIKTLEAYGIGRPSTYAPIISVIQTRNYVEKNKDRRFQPTETGELVNKVLVENFPEIVDIQFTAKMEEQLDAVAEGKENWRELLGDFYKPFSKELKEKYESVQKEEALAPQVTDEKCDKCGRPMVIKMGRFGKFLACSGFPECKNTKSIVKPSEKFGPCPKCGEGEIRLKKTKKGRIFYGCSRYPDCDWSSWKKPGTATEEEEG
ncbi:type I DNA topoisomerase [Patescibacteria group bacterium]|nr:type I DNA topoisomerase [Patescibacteria group bacterium]MCL5114783.1 type I DNA topoisomerase [Patescibacteria group bacterium]